jgi:hypothetical protein
MFISISGVLLRAAKRISKTADSHLEYPLRQLYSHIQQIQIRHARGESKEVLDEFFGIWTQLDASSGEPHFDGQVEEERRKTVELEKVVKSTDRGRRVCSDYPSPTWSSADVGES